MQSLLRDAFHQRYGVTAFNVVNQLTLRAVLEAASDTRSPVIIQVSVKTARQLGVRLVQKVFAEIASTVPVPTALHLDHCPDRALIEECVAAGWNSVLFDASNLTYAENLRQTTEVAAFAHAHGVAVEGELEAVRGVEDGLGQAGEGTIVPLDQALAFVRQTGIDSFAPAIGTAHGVYRDEPVIDFDRVRDLVAAEPIPIVLHGGTGLRDEVLRQLVALGAVKVNLSTQLKITYTDSLRRHLESHPREHDPLRLHAAVRDDVQSMAADYMRRLGSAGRAAA